MGGSLEGKLFHQTTCLQNVNLSERKHLTIKKAKKKKLSGNAQHQSVGGFWGVICFVILFFFEGGRGVKGEWGLLVY